MTTHDTWILVAVPARLGPRRVAARVGLALLGWSEQRRERRPRSVDLHRVDRALAAPRPFC